MAHDVFISHSSKDKAVADAVCATLEQHQIRCWIAPRDIGPGAEWGESIVTAIHASRVMVLIFSASANESPQIRREVERAVHSNVVIVPMRIEDVLPQKSLEYFIGAVHWLDAFSKPLEDYLENLCGVVAGILGGPNATRAAQVGAVREKKKVALPVWAYAGAGFAVVLIVVLVVFLSMSKPVNSGDDRIPVNSVAANASQAGAGNMTPAPATAGSPAGNSPVVTPPNGTTTAPPRPASSAGAAQPAAVVHLRSEKQTVSVDEAKIIVVTHNFFRVNWNASGKGVAHQYETKAEQGALVVVDHATGLMWQRGGSGDSHFQAEWKEAPDYIRGLNAKKFAGYDDWRVPTLEEAMSLMSPPGKGQPGELDYGEGRLVKGEYHIDPAFDNDAAAIMWTSDIESPARSWILYFWDGTCDPERNDYNGYVRAVRTSKSAKD